MMFKNLAVFRLPVMPMLASSLNTLLDAKQLQGCSASDAQSIGWVNPSNAGNLAHVVNGQILLCLGVEQKLLPAAVVKQYAEQWAKNIEDTEVRMVGRKEMRELREEMTLNLLPKAFVRQRRTFGWIDPVNGWLVVDAATTAKAEEFLEHLRKTVEGFPAKLLKVKHSPSFAMTGWVAGGEAPAGFTIDQDLELRSAEKATVRYAHHHLEGEDIREHIAGGKVGTKLAMTWADRISFVLTDNLQIKRLTFLDILKEQVDGRAENEEERFDLDFTLMTGEVARMLADVVEALGGELESV